MNDTKILQLLEKLAEGQEALTKDMQDLKHVQVQTNAKLDNQDKKLDSLTKDMQDVKQAQNQTNTALKVVATKGDVEVAVSTAKEEIQANIIDLGAKINRKLHNHETRIENLEDHTGTTDPTKH